LLFAVLPHLKAIIDSVVFLQDAQQIDNIADLFHDRVTFYCEHKKRQGAQMDALPLLFLYYRFFMP
jgi:hypothetical protein